MYGKWLRGGNVTYDVLDVESSDCMIQSSVEGGGRGKG